MNLLYIALGGGAGALARYWIGLYVARRSRSVFPWGTYLINVTGALVLGCLSGLTLGGSNVPAPWQLGLGTGFLGAFTTFSTWMLETGRLASAGRSRIALLNIVGSTMAGLTSAAMGVAAGRALAR